MKELFAFKVVFSDPTHNANPFLADCVTCHVFDDDGEAWEVYSIPELSKVFGLDPAAFDEFAEEGSVYITAMAFVEMCYYSRNLMSYATSTSRLLLYTKLQEVAVELLDAAARAHFPAQAKIYEQRLEELRNAAK